MEDLILNLQKQNIQIQTNENLIKEETKNSLTINNEVLLIAYPKTREELIYIVKLANEKNIPLYPISRGFNLGYGSKMPITDKNILIDMKYFNKISSFSKENGTIRIESGVTQKQLYDYLIENNLPYFMDVTGSSGSASIMGNILDGGFGHTPAGYKRENFSNAEILLGSGEILKTDSFPTIGPDLAGLFVQSNFGIIISCEINLNYKTEHFESFIIQLNGEENLYNLIEKISILKQQKVLTSLVHVANPLRTFMTSYTCPDEYKNQVLSNQKAKELQNYKLLKSFDYTAAGGLYGTKKEIKIKKKIIKKTFKKHFKIIFFNDTKINLLKNILKHEKLVNTFKIDYVKKVIDSFEPTYNLMKGIPNDKIYENILWKVDKLSDLGMMWVSPVVCAKKEELSTILKILEESFEKYNFELPITMTFVKPGKLIFIININFNKNNIDEANRAKELYREIVKKVEENGLGFYRKPILFVDDLYKNNKQKEMFLKEIKKITDPNNIISQKRYGL